MEKTHVITSATAIYDEQGKWFAVKVRARSKKNEKYGVSKTYSPTEVKAKFSIESPENVKNLINKECNVSQDLVF